MLDGDRKHAVFDRVQSSFSEELRKVALTRPGEPGLTLGFWIQLPDRVPELTQWPPTAIVIPDACRNDPTPTCDAGHFTQTVDGILHEVDNELSQCRIECPILERKMLRGR